MVPSARNFASAASVTAASARLIAATRPNADLIFLIAQLQGRTRFNTSAMQWSERGERHGRLRREGSGERVGRRTSSIDAESDVAVTKDLLRIKNFIDGKFGEAAFFCHSERSRGISRYFCPIHHD